MAEITGPHPYSDSSPLTGIERIGIPRHLLWGFVGVLLFMVGDGVETTFLTQFLTEPSGPHLSGSEASFATVTLYGLAVLIASWFSGTLSAIWGPRRVMWLGAVWWVVFQILFLFIALPAKNAALILTFYSIRGFAYPLFAFSFLVWAQVSSPQKMRGSVAGWFWFAFTGGLPTAGAAIAAIAIGPLNFSFRATLIVSLVIVAAGGLIGSLCVTDPSGLQPIADEAVPNPRSLKRLFEGIDILWRDRRVLAGGLVRIVNTAPEYAFFALFPFTLGPATPGGGFLTASEVSELATIAYAANIIANLFFGVFGDRFGWRRTVTWFGCLGCAISGPLWYFLAVSSRSFAVAIIFGIVYALLLAGFVPLSALMPSMVSVKDKGASLAILNLGAGGAAFIGPVIITIFYPLGGGGLVAIVLGVLYLIVGGLSFALKDPSDPAVRRQILRRAAAQ